MVQGNQNQEGIRFLIVSDGSKLWTEEESMVEERIMNSRNSHVFIKKIHSCDPAEIFLQIKQWKPHIVHFCGLWQADGTCFSLPTEKISYLWSRDEIMKGIGTMDHPPRMIAFNGLMRLEDMAYSDMKIHFMFFMNGGANGDVFRLFFPAFYARICLGEPIGRVYNSVILPKELCAKRPVLYCKSQEDLMNSVTGRSPEYGSGNLDVYEMGAEPLSWNDILPLAAAAIARNQAAMERLDQVSRGTWLIKRQLPAEEKKRNSSYYGRHTLDTEYQAYKAEQLLLAAGQKGKDHEQAAEALRQVLRDGWPAFYSYVAQSSDPMNLDRKAFTLLRSALPGNTKKGENRNKIFFAHQMDMLKEQSPDVIRDTEVKRYTVEECSVVLVIVKLSEKQVVDAAPVLTPLRKGCRFVLRGMEAGPGHSLMTKEDKEKADQLWDFVKNFFTEIPLTIGECEGSPRGKILAPWYHMTSMKEFPGLEMIDAPVSVNDLRRGIESMAVSLRGKDITEEKKRDGLYYFLHILILQVCGQKYWELRQETRQKMKREASVLRQVSILEAQLKKAREKQKEAVWAERRRVEKEWWDQQKRWKIELHKKEESLKQQEQELTRERASFADMLRDMQEGLESEQKMSEEEANGKSLELSEEEQAFLAGLRVVVLGGLPKWQTRLHQTYPNIICISPENLHFDKSFIKDADAVVAAIKYMGHSMGQRAMVRYLNEYGGRRVYFYGTNEDRLMRRIYEEFHRECAQ